MNVAKKISALIATLIFASCSKNNGASQLNDQSTLDTTCNDQALLNDLDNLSFICDGLSQTSTSLVKLCLDRVDTMLQGETTEGCLNKIRPALQKMTTNLLIEESASLAITAAGALDPDAIKAFFGNFNLWYYQLAETLFRDFTLREGLADRQAEEMPFSVALDRISENIWRRINSNISLEGLSNPFHSQTFDGVRAILESALTAPADGVRAPQEFVLQMFVDAMMPLNERSNMLIELHDLSCQLRDCRNTTDAVPLRQMVSLNESLVSKTKMSDRLTNANLIPTSVKQIYKVFAANQSYLLADLEVAIGSDYETKILTIDTASVPSSLRDFVGFVQKNAQLTANLRNTGFYSGRDSNTLETGLSSELVTAIKNRNQNLVDRLQAKLNTFESDRNLLLSNLRQKVDLDMQSVDQSYASRALAFKTENLINDLDGVRRNLAERRESFSEYYKQIEQAKSTDNVRFFENRVTDQSQSLFTFDASEAYYLPDNGPVANISELSVQKIPVKTGEVAHLQVSGQWSPVCALKKSPYAQGLDLEQVRVGPSGFVVTQTNGSSQVDSVEKSERETSYTDLNASVSACAGVGVNVGVASAKVQACVNYTMGKRNEQVESESTVHSQQFRSDATFYAGMRLKDTPFRRYPAGALLAVVVPKDKSLISNAIETHVVSQDTYIIAQIDSDIHLIVNDCQHDFPAGENLTVNLAVLKTAQPSAEELLTNVVKALETFQKKGSKALEAGNFAPRLLANEKQAFIAQLTVNETITPDFFQFPVLRELFNYWLDNEIVKMELMAESMNLERQMKLLALEASKLDEFEGGTASSKKILELQIHHASNNVDQFVLVDPLMRISSYTRNRLLPMVRLHFAKSLAQLSAEELKWLTPAIDAPLDDIARHVVKIVEELSENLSDEYSLAANQDQTMYLLMRYPRPDTEPVAGNLAMPTADAARSKKLWESILMGDGSGVESVTLDLAENDLYRPDLTFGRLTCKQVRPIVTDMMLAFVAKSSSVLEEQVSSWNNRFMSVNSSFEPFMSIPQSEGALRYRLVNKDIGSKSLALGFVRSNEIPEIQQMLAAKSYAEGAGLGMSPFGSINVSDIQSLRSIFVDDVTGCESCINRQYITDIVVAFKVEVVTVSDSSQIRWLDRCKGASL